MSENIQGGTPINADIVFCIDGTSSMSRKSADGESRLIDEAKAHAEKLSEEFIATAADHNYALEKLRIKVIVFRDYEYDGDMSMQQTDFYTIPDQAPELTSFIKSIDAVGGGDAAENALEALAYAFRSDWTKEGGGSRRHITVLFTDAPALPLGDRKDCSGYPDDLPKSLEELKEMWTCADQMTTMSTRWRRLVIIAPSDESWAEIASWEAVTSVPVNLNAGLSELSMEDIIGYVVKSF